MSSRAERGIFGWRRSRILACARDDTRLAAGSAVSLPRVRTWLVTNSRGAHDCATGVARSFEL
ncbi:MAG: hypothetical protein OJF58_000406 [Enhydrobacter sp.]|nr:MAG: hypothetical protein OJF58_000406 [Enhydrobacter sp.]